MTCIHDKTCVLNSARRERLYRKLFQSSNQGVTAPDVKKLLHEVWDEVEREQRRAESLGDALNSLVAVARRYLPDYNEHPEIQKADAALELLTPNA